MLFKLIFKGEIVGGSGRWIHGNSLIQNDAGTKYIGDKIAPSKINESNVHEVVHVCVCTCQIDINDVLIYEHGIIHDTLNDKLYKVEFINGCFCACDLGGNEPWGNEKILILDILLESHKIEVVGNIFDSLKK